jgi:hypothetical protein
MLTQEEVKRMSTNAKGFFAENRAKKALISEGYSVTKITEDKACNDFTIQKEGVKSIAEIKGAVDYGYTKFFCEVAQKRAEDILWDTSFWIGQEIHFFLYYSFSEDTTYLYDGKLFKAKTFRLMEENKGKKDEDKLIKPNKTDTGNGFTFDKEDKDMGFLCKIKHITATII